MKNYILGQSIENTDLKSIQRCNFLAEIRVKRENGFSYDYAEMGLL